MPARVANVGGATVRRGLPRAHRTVGAWCLLDHAAPEPGGPPVAIGPHPHIGLQTATWLLDGEVVHTDSLGSEQVIRPGELNLMSAGHGVAHAEDGRASAHTPHVVQLWIAQPESTRDAPPQFEHYSSLPALELPHARGTVFIGELDDVTAPTRLEAPVVGADLSINGAIELPLHEAFEYGVFVLSGTVAVEGTPVEADALAHLGIARVGRDRSDGRAHLAARRRTGGRDHHVVELRRPHS